MAPKRIVYNFTLVYSRTESKKAQWRGTNEAELYILTHTPKNGQPLNEEVAAKIVCYVFSFSSSISLISILLNKQVPSLVAIRTPGSS